MPGPQFKSCLNFEELLFICAIDPCQSRLCNAFCDNTVESLILGWSQDSISTLLCHSVQFKNLSNPCGTTVEIKLRDRPDMGDSTVLCSA